MRKVPEDQYSRLRGDIAQRKIYVVPFDTVGEHLAHWSGQAVEFAPDDLSVRASTPRILAERFAEISALHVRHRKSLLELAWPLKPAELLDFQLKCCAALGASALLRLQPAGVYVDAAPQAGPDAIPEVLFDPDALYVRWHVEHGYESDLIEGFEPGDEPEQWYKDPDSGLLVRVRRTAVATPEFETDFAAFFKSEFDPHAYSTITGVASIAMMQAIDQIDVPNVESVGGRLVIQA